MAKKVVLGLVTAYLPLPSRGPSRSVMAWHVWFAGPSSVFFCFFVFKSKFTTTLYILFLFLEVKFLTSLARERNGRARN